MARFFIKCINEEMFNEMRQSGKTLLISTHIIDSVDMLWDRALIMQNGQIKANVSKAQLDQDGLTLEQLFFGVTEGVNQDEMQHKEEMEPAENSEAEKE